MLDTAPSSAQVKIVDAVLIIALEAGFTPSSAAARVPFKHSVESLTAGVATGLLAATAGLFSQAETVARWLDRLIANPNVRGERAVQIVASYHNPQRTIPSFSHHMHRDKDPRARALLELTADLGVAGHRLRCLLMR